MARTVKNFYWEQELTEEGWGLANGVNDKMETRKLVKRRFCRTACKKSSEREVQNCWEGFNIQGDSRLRGEREGKEG